MTATITKWGNSSGIRISKILLDALGLSINDEVNIENVDNNALIIKKSSNAAHDKLIKRLENFYGTSIDKISKIQEQEEDFGKSVGEELPW